MNFTEEDKEILKDFYNTFNVISHSMARQEITIDLDAGTSHYEDTVVYGETAVLDIVYADNLVKSFEEPEDDIKVIFQYAIEWDKAGRPTDYKDKFFN